MRVEICVEKLSGHDTEGKLGKIEVAVGDEIKSGDLLFAIESGKGSVKSKSKYDGKVVEIAAKTGDTLKKGAVVLVIEGQASQENTRVSSADAKPQGYSFGIAKPKKEVITADIAIVGGGPGGYVAAIRGAQLGKRVVLIEEDRMGGTCLNYGCIPTKALAHSTKVLRHIQDAENYGFNVASFDINMERVIERKSEVVDTLVGGIEHLMEANDIQVVKGTALLESDTQIKVENKKVSATINFENLIIATGSEVSYINIEGHDLDSIITSKDALELKEVPKSITIIGGGVIGMEFAFIFNALGSEVHVIEYLPEILALLDQDAADVIRASADAKGIKVHAGACAAGIYETENQMMMTSYQKEGQMHYVATEKVMMAVGRRARIENLNLEELGVDLNERENGIKVDAHMRTTNERIYAIGDVTNIVQLAHVASHQGIVAVECIAGLDSEMHYDLIPSAIFTSPEVGHVGLTEKSAAEQGLDIKVSHFHFAANGKSVAMGETEGFVKIISSPETETILGATIVGANGTDMIATLSNLIADATKLEAAAKIIYAHPTAAESVHEAILGALDKGLHNA